MYSLPLPVQTNNLLLHRFRLSENSLAPVIMVRTVCKSGKSTGGPANRSVLPGPFKLVSGLCGEQVIKSVYHKPLPHGMEEAISTRKKDILIPQFWNHVGWCLFCCDGSPQMYECSHCPHTVCVRCIVIPEESLDYIKKGNVFFRCPGCHEVRDRNAGKGIITPYFGFEDAQGKAVLATPATIHGHIELTSRSEVCTLPILILNFILASVDIFGSPARAMRDGLHPYVAPDYYEIVFDIGTLSKVKQHAKAMEKLVQDIGPCQFACVEVFVHSHSDTNRGDLWAGFETSNIKGEHEGPVAYSLDDFFTAVFPSSIAGYLKGATLWMLHAFAFDAERFHACLVPPFIFAYVERVLVEGFEVEEAIEDLLKAAPQLGMHTSIIHIRVTNIFHRRPPTVSEYNKGAMRMDDKASMIVTTYKFFHENQHPWGNPLPYQCLRCYCVRSWGSTTRPMSSNTQFACKQCGFVITYTKLDHSKIILYHEGYRGTSKVSGKLTKKGLGTGSGWLVVVAVEPDGVLALAQSVSHSTREH
ncbi:uncharacterized protein F5147DRAFT_647030 [Suillus discolor]|uniref:Uncharacterized protein n=1 Tax=Suillus discolor TaxID=1912936 RepID=A0A9P7K0U3_9AGAM|nr:uncharacterized protein F5147DRAFT_647030 [Suillus discolor]KAG2120545.1 hypothetical protein F5147DRAFT_647030 [Suillus discolor]